MTHKADKSHFLPRIYVIKGEKPLLKVFFEFIALEEAIRYNLQVFD